MEKLVYPVTPETYVELFPLKKSIAAKLKRIKARMVRDEKRLRMLENMEREARRVTEIRNGIPLSSGMYGVSNLGYDYAGTRSANTFFNQHNQLTWRLRLITKDKSGYNREDIWHKDFPSDAEAMKWAYEWVMYAHKPDHYEKQFLANLKGI